jgi:hypothetical protein
VTVARGLSAFALLVLPLACTTSASSYPPLPPTGAGGAGGTTSMPNGDVSVTITAPTDGATIPNASDINITATVAVVNPTDLAKPTDFIDTSSVKVTLTAMGSAAVVANGQLVANGNDVYAGAVSVGNLQTGTYTLTVSAKSQSGLTGMSSVTITIQSGPTLIVNSPAEGKPYSDSLTIEVFVDPGAMAPTALLAGMPVTWPIPPNPTNNGTYDVYRATVWFGPPPAPANAQAFPPLSGPQLLDVKESSSTTPITTSEVQRTFVIDTTGPTITATTPPPGVVVGGVLKISATVMDDSGVLDSSVVAIIGDDQGNPVFNLQLEPQGGGVYSTLFDTANLTQCKPRPSTALCIVYPTVSFRATDSVGNETSLGYEFGVDNIPPLSDLDPPLMRQMRLTAFGYECSKLFDPLSVNRDLGDMPNDGCMVPQVFDLRARISDQGNRANGLKITPVAGIDPDNTNVYVLADTNQPLVVDTDGDGYCDAINPLLAPTTGPLTQSDQVLKIRLAGVPQAGSADFYANDYDAADLAVPSNCIKGSDLAPPKVLCTIDGFEQPTIVIGYPDVPEIWSVEPIDSARCVGNQFDTMANNVHDGQWICMAVGSADLAGSMGVSTPMRVYVKYDEAGGFCATPPSNAGPPPTCTGTYDPVMKTAAVGSCQTLKFTGTDLYCAPGGC